MYYILEPDVAGNIADSVADWSVHPPHITKLRYTFDDWGGDAIIQAFPCYIVTSETAAAMRKEGFTGISFDDVETRLSDSFYQLCPGGLVPTFEWLKIHGRGGEDDLGLLSDFRLVVSQGFLSFLRRSNRLVRAEVSEFP